MSHNFYISNIGALSEVEKEIFRNNRENANKNCRSIRLQDTIEAFDLSKGICDVYDKKELNAYFSKIQKNLSSNSTLRYFALENSQAFMEKCNDYEEITGVKVSPQSLQFNNGVSSQLIEFNLGNLFDIEREQTGLIAIFSKLKNTDNFHVYEYAKNFDLFNPK